MARIIVVTGPSGRGKTEVSTTLARLTGYRHINIGDALQASIESMLDWTPLRRDIGRIYFDHYSMEDYLSLLDKLASPGTILDGIRFAVGIERLRANNPELLHIHLTFGDNKQLKNAMQRYDRYSEELPQLETIADRVVDWFVDTKDMEKQIVTGFADILSVCTAT